MNACDPQSLTVVVICWCCGVQNKNHVGWNTAKVRIPANTM